MVILQHEIAGHANSKNLRPHRSRYEVIRCLFWWKLGIAEGAPELVLQATRARLIAGWTPDGVNLWSVGNYGIIQHSVDGGKAWTVQNSCNLSELRSVWGISIVALVQRL